MGEFATYKGEDVKIGTCENLYYLRADQLDSISGAPENILEWARFRFPFPGEDHIEPGSFHEYNRSVPLHGLTAPADLADDHYTVQFVAHAGYNVCLPCPESTGAEQGFGPIDVGGFKVHRNGFSGAVQLVQQRYVDGCLVAIVRCGGCGMAWRLKTIHDAEPAIESLIAEGERRESKWYVTLAQRICDGYTIADRLRQTLETLNPDEPGGDWSAYALAQAVHVPTAIVNDHLIALDACARYVGGTSQYLYSLASVGA